MTLTPYRWLLVLPLLVGFDVSLVSSTVTYSARDSVRAWQGVTHLERLEVRPQGAALAVVATLEPGTFDSGNFVRDGNARFSVFEANTYPTAELTGTLALEQPLSDTDWRTQQSTFEGTLTLHGVTQPLSFPVTLSRDGDSVKAASTFTVLLSDYQMQRPSLFGVVVDDDVALSVLVEGVILGD